MGLVCIHSANAEDALRQVGIETPELMLAGLTSRPKNSSLELLVAVKKRSPHTEVVLVSAFESPETAVEAMRLGAYDCIAEPLGDEKVRLILERMVEKVRLVRENEFLRNRLRNKAQWSSTPTLQCTDLEELERQTVRRVFEQVHGDKQQAQKLLGISRATLYRKIKRYGIEPRLQATKKKARDAAERMILLSQS
jgi:DNA-binding NtrC family response regulator